MKKVTLLALVSLLFGAQNPSALPMPPMVPQLDKTQKAHKDSKFPPSCSTLPPMIFLLPPPMEATLQQCKNDLFLPKKSEAEKKFKTKVLLIEPVEGFSQLYRIVTKERILFCNARLDRCIEGKVIRP